MRLILGDPDPRTPREIARDIDDELAFHLEMIERELHAEGRGEREAKEEARRRFGDVERVRRACAQIALKERAVLQRVNLVLIVVVGALALAALYTQWQGQRSTLAAIEDIKGRLDRLPAAVPSATGAGGEGGGASSPRGVIILTELERGGQLGRSDTREVMLPASGEPSILHVLGRAAIEPSRDTVVQVLRTDETGEYKTLRLISYRRLREDRRQDVALRDGDRIRVEPRRAVSISGDILGSAPGVTATRVLPGFAPLTIRSMIVAANHFPRQVHTLTRTSSDRGNRVTTVWRGDQLDAEVLAMPVEPDDEFVLRSACAERVAQLREDEDLAKRSPFIDVSFVPEAADRSRPIFQMATLIERPRLSDLWSVVPVERSEARWIEIYSMPSRGRGASGTLWRTVPITDARSGKVDFEMPEFSIVSISVVSRDGRDAPAPDVKPN